MRSQIVNKVVEYRSFRINYTIEPMKCGYTSWAFITQPYFKLCKKLEIREDKLFLAEMERSIKSQSKEWVDEFLELNNVDKPLFWKATRR